VADDAIAEAVDQSPFSLTGSVAAVIGTSANIGTGIALQLAAAGARVACVDRDPGIAKRAADEVRARGGAAMAVDCDVTSEQDVIDAVNAVTAEFGLIDVLVNGPVIYLEKGIRSMSLSEWRGQLAVLLDGTFLFTKYVSAALIQAGRPGAIVNLISTAGHQGEPDNIGYATAKGGVLNMTRSAAVELAPFGIRVNSLTPTATDPTEGIERGLRWGIEGVAKAHVDALAVAASQVPLGVLPSPSDYGNAVVYLASAAGRMVTGTDLRVDAGSIAKYWRVKPAPSAS
jgi:NAD(P)-dependent dehydrogenase (short-subunit alcohol dehydrogenase family)